MAKLKTGRHTSSLKERRKAVKRTEHNTSLKSRIHTLIKKFEEAAKKDATQAQALLKTVFSELDKAARKNIIHKNLASNQKARLSKLIAGKSKK